MVARVGFEGSQPAEFTSNSDGSRSGNGARADVSARPRVDAGPREQRAGQGTEQALGKALAEASAAGRWDVVVQLARELELRRTARE
jgi:hypothetical protein